MAAATAPEEKASLDKVLEARKAVLAATAKTWDLNGAGDAVATQRYADEEFAPLVTIESASLNLKYPFGLSLSKPCAALRRAQRERFK